MSVIRYFDIKVGESLKIGSDLTITLEKKSGQLARLMIDKPESTRVEVRRNSAAAHAARGISSAVR